MTLPTLEAAIAAMKKEGIPTATRLRCERTLRDCSGPPMIKAVSLRIRVSDGLFGALRFRHMPCRMWRAAMGQSE